MVDERHGQLAHEEARETRRKQHVVDDGGQRVCHNVLVQHRQVLRDGGPQDSELGSEADQPVRVEARRELILDEVRERPESGLLNKRREQEGGDGAHALTVARLTAAPDGVRKEHAAKSIPRDGTEARDISPRHILVHLDFDGLVDATGEHKQLQIRRAICRGLLGARQLRPRRAA